MVFNVILGMYFIAYGMLCIALHSITALLFE